MVPETRPSPVHPHASASILPNQEPPGGFRRIGRTVSGLQLNLIAGLILLSILAISLNALWSDRQAAWQEAEKAARNVLTALSRDMSDKVALIDLSLKGVIEGQRYQGFQSLPPEIQHRMLFDRAASATFAGTILLVDRRGELVSDGGTVVAPRPMNVADQDFFTAQRDGAVSGLFLSRPFRSALNSREPSIAISRAVIDSNQRFNGVVAAIVSLSQIRDMFQKLDIGHDGSISVFRDDGVLLVRQPYSETNVGRDLSATPNVHRFMETGSGSFAAAATIDRVRRLFVFNHIDGAPLIITVSLSVRDILSTWTQKAMVLSLVTCALCSAVVGLTALFQRELRRRTRAEAELARLARTDSLTGLPNRRAFDEAFHREWRNAARAERPITLLFVDADSFKHYNDCYGHGKGDDLLRDIGLTIASFLRGPGDFAARYGGEEFTVLLRDTDLSAGRMVAEDIRHGIQSMHIAHDRSVHRVATVSVGVATARPRPGMPSLGLIEAADLSLYEAKAEGRNCVRCREAQTRHADVASLSVA